MANLKDQVAQFGKYKGKLISWIIANDIQYAEWLAKRPTRQKTQRSAQSQLDKLKNKI